MFITFEGGEGCGKTTLAESILEALKKDHDVLFTFEPGGTLFGSGIRQWVLEHRELKLTPPAELFLYLADRAQHIDELIVPALNAGKIVLSDRYADSSIAYQGVARGLGFDYVEECCHVATRGLVPDITFFVDIDPAIGLKRVLDRRKGKSTLDRIEREELAFHQKLRVGYQMIAKKYPSRIVTLDGTKTPQELFNEAFAIIQKRLKK